jgi:Zn-dependent metalloprotease
MKGWGWTMKPLRKGSFKVVPGEWYGTPKEVWGFRSAKCEGKPATMAREFLHANRELFKLEPDLSDLSKKPRVIESLGAHHVIFQQRHLGLRVHRAYVTVHIGRDRRVYLVKCRATPEDLLPERADFRKDKDFARRRALKAIRSTARSARVVGSVERLWFPQQDRLCEAWRVRLHRQRPRQEWIVYINGRTGGVLSRYDNLAHATGRAMVFDPNPVIALGDHTRLLTDNGNPRKPPGTAYRRVVLRGLQGNGYLEGRRVTTRPTRRRVRRTSHRFFFESTQRGFEEVMVYYHVDRAIRYLESLGFRGRRRIFDEPLAVNVNGTRRDNSWYSPGLERLTFGTGGVDDAEDAETILHELGHALQDMICPDFGQSDEAAAMGEGFGDYFAASFFASKKKKRYETSVMTWDGITFDEDYDPPCVRRVDEEWTYADFDADLGEHENGLIWSATLWDVRQALGRRTADTLIVESHFQLDGFTTFARGARAILDADRNLYRNRHRARLRRIFRDRAIAPV